MRFYLLLACKRRHEDAYHIVVTGLPMLRQRQIKLVVGLAHSCNVVRVVWACSSRDCMSRSYLVGCSNVTLVIYARLGGIVGTGIAEVRSTHAVVRFSMWHLS
jgi:hypothetical protein